MTILNGSEKQIAWAESIRNNMLNGNVIEMGIISYILDAEKTAGHYKAKCEKKGKDFLTHIGYKEASDKIRLFSELKNRVENEESASWFIDNRNTDKLFVKEVFSKC